jgi:hypothetical protein
MTGDELAGVRRRIILLNRICSYSKCAKEYDAASVQWWKSSMRACLPYTLAINTKTSPQKCTTFEETSPPV